MKVFGNLSAFFYFLFVFSPVLAGDYQDVSVTVSTFTAQQLADLNSGMGPDDMLRVQLSPGTNGEMDIVVGANDGGPNALLNLSDLQRIEIFRDAASRSQNKVFRFLGTGAGKRLFITDDMSHLGLEGVLVQDFSPPGQADGGAGIVRDDSMLDAWRTQWADNTGFFGGALAANGRGMILVQDSFFYRNAADLFGGSIALLGGGTAKIARSGFFDGQAGSDGCDIHVEGNAIYRYDSGLILSGNHHTSSLCGNSLIHNPFGRSMSYANTVLPPSSSVDGWKSVGTDRHFGDFLGQTPPPVRLMADQGGGGKPKSACEDFGSGSFVSLGYNIAEDNSCDLDQSTDLPSTAGMVAPNGSNIYVPQTGSPMIDSGAIDVQLFPGESLESLPCGYKDIMGLGRPQDANDDGMYECDRGAVEVAGPGALTPGHSAAFFNVNRDGEGQYVEMLNANLAIVYTFTHRPDGSGSMWFIGVGYVLGNSIVIDQLLRPSGTSFGSGFDSSEIVNTLSGGQSMVFNDCEAAGLGGNVAFSGNKDIGLEALISRAGRLSNILGCGSITPHPNAGLSGSYFLPARDGEGIVVQWLPNGQVLVIFFTYDLNNNQQWVLGIGQSNGTSVTMDAVYASSNTEWGSEYDPDDVVLSPWGTFELIWTQCGGVQFIYNSTVPGYGSATREYIRLSSLWEATCPDF